MPELPYLKARRTYSFAFRSVLALSTLSFLLATVYTQWRLTGIEEAAATIEAVSSPSIEHLLEMRVALNEVGRASAAFVAEVRQGDGVSADHLNDALQSLEERSSAYLTLKLLPMEGEKWTAVDLGVKNVIRTVKAMTHSAGNSSTDVVTRQFLESVQPAILALSEAIPLTIAHDANVAQGLGRDIRRLHEETFKIVVILDALSLALTILAGIIVFLMFRRHARSEDDHNRLQADRVEELSIFAGRIAHDIKNPLATISMAIEVLTLSESPTEATETIELTKKALQRATHLVDGLLSFACAGSNPTTNGHSNVKTVLTDIGSEYREIARRAKIDFSVDCPISVEVGCSTGVLTSMVENLIRNAIKFMGSSEMRRIVARAQVQGQVVHVEIEDSGPGIPEEIKDRLFEPFVSGPSKEGNGVGLGLATVKRLVEAYGGAIGVRSNRSSGATFWFDLPMVSA